MKYMLLIYSDPTTDAGADMSEWFAYTEALATAGALVAGDALQGSDTATTVRVREGRTLHTDGPFAETKEVLGGYYLIDVPTLDEALAWAAKIPNVGWGSIEVRPLFDMSTVG
jgi:hypothetical protein